MLQSLRTVLLAAAGAVDLSDQKLQAVLDDLVKRGELAADDAREFAERWRTRAREQRAAGEARMRAAIDEALSRAGVASEASLRELQARVEELERKIAALEPQRS